MDSTDASVLENQRKWDTFLQPLWNYRKPRTVSNIKIKNRIPGTQCLSQSFADKLLENTDKPITVRGSPMDVRKAARNFQKQNDAISPYLHREKNGASSASTQNLSNDKVGHETHTDISRSAIDETSSEKNAVIEIGDGDSQEQGTSHSPTNLIPVLSVDQINIELIDNSKENPIAISDDSSDEQEYVTRMPTAKRKQDDTSVSEISVPSPPKRAMTSQSLLEVKTDVDDETKRPVDKTIEGSILCGNANSKIAKDLSLTESDHDAVTKNIKEGGSGEEKHFHRALSEEPESTRLHDEQRDRVKYVQSAEIGTNNGNQTPCYTINEDDTQNLAEKKVESSVLCGNVKNAKVAKETSFKESIHSEVTTNIKTPKREESITSSQINALKSASSDHSPLRSKAKLPSISLFDTGRNSEILKETEETLSDEEFHGTVMSAILSVQQMASLKKEYSIERPRTRNERSPNKKDDIDKPCSQWKIESFARYFDFEKCVEELKVEIYDDLDKFSYDLNHMVSEFKRRVSIASSADKHHKRCEGGKPNFASLCRTEMGTRLILNEILFPLCSFLDFSVEIERNVDCLYLPNCRFDYRIFDKDGEIVGAVETKSAGSLRPDAVAQAVIELCILQTERLTRAKDSAKLLKTPLFNVLTDGVRFVFIVLKGNKIHFEQAFNRIYVREMSDWGDVSKLYLSLMQLMRSEIPLCSSQEKVD